MSQPGRTQGILGTPYLLPMLGFALLVVVVSHAVPWVSGPLLASQLRTQQRMLMDLVNYQRLLSSLDESSRAVVLAPQRADLRQKKINAIQDLRDQLDQLAADAPIEGNIPHSLIGLATHFRKEVVGKADEVDRYAMAPGNWGIERFRKHYGAARAEHELLVQALINETRGIADQALGSAQSRITLSAGVLLLLWAGALSYFTVRARKEARLAHLATAGAHHATVGETATAAHPEPAKAAGAGTQFRSRESVATSHETAHRARVEPASPTSVEQRQGVAAAAHVAAVATQPAAAAPKASHPSLVPQADLDGLVHSHPAVREEAAGSVVDLSAIGTEVAGEGVPEGGVIDLNALLAQDPAAAAPPASAESPAPSAPGVVPVSAPAPQPAPASAPLSASVAAIPAAEAAAPAVLADIPELKAGADQPSVTSLPPVSIDLSDLVPTQPDAAPVPTAASAVGTPSIDTTPPRESRVPGGDSLSAPKPAGPAVTNPTPEPGPVGQSAPEPAVAGIAPVSANPSTELTQAPPAEIDLSDLLPAGTAPVTPPPSSAPVPEPPAAGSIEPMVSPIPEAAASPTPAPTPAPSPVVAAPAPTPAAPEAAVPAAAQPTASEKAAELPPKGSAAALAAGRSKGGTQDVKELMKDARGMTAEQLTAMLFGGRGNAPAEPPKPSPAPAPAPPPEPPRTITGADVAAPADGAAGPIDLSF